ncbi:uncharacterized protein LOC144425896 [Styela clava]
MKISIVFILIYVLTSSWCQYETVFHCSPKPGCQIAQCDPVAVGWDRPGFSIDEHLHDKEFPIICKSKNAAKPQNIDIGHIKSDLRELEEEFENKLKNIGSSGDDAKESGSKIEEQAKEINNLKRRDKQQSDEMKNLKEDLIEVQEINNNLVEKLNEQKKINDEMKKAMFRIEQKLAVMDKPHQLPNRSRQITKPTTKTRTTLKPTTKTQTTLKPTTKTRTTLKPTTKTRTTMKPTTKTRTTLKPTTKTRTTLKPTTKTRTTLKPTTTIRTTVKPTPAPENCKLKVGSICYYAVIRNEWSVIYSKAVDICKKRNADVGLIRDEESYNAVMNYLREKIPEGERKVWIWTGIKIDPMTGDVTPAYSFTKWYPGDPKTGIEYKDRTNVCLVVKADPNDRRQGMENVYPTFKLHGVICEILI